MTNEPQPPSADREGTPTSSLLADFSRPYLRSGTGLEFERFAFFSDAVFAIALTLLVVGIAVPTVRDAGDSSEMWDTLLDLKHEFISFFVGFAVIGRYWLAHHRFVAVLAAVDARLMMVNLVYLAFIAFLPFPTALVGRYEENLVAFAFYALTLAVISFLETLFFVVASRRRLLPFTVPREVARFGLFASTLPVAVFVLSIPLAVVTNSTVALLSWILIWPLEALIDRFKPVGGDAWPQT
jgi:uncharacterized membrane protein